MQMGITTTILLPVVLQVGNPVALALEPLNRVTSTRAIGNFFLEYTLMEGLILKSSLGADYSSARRDAYLPTTTRRGRGVSGSSAISTREVTSWLNENTLTYQKQFDRHGLTVLGGYTMQGQNNIFVLASTQGFTSDEFGTDNVLVSGIGPTRVANSGLKWETTAQFDAGIDVGPV
jgi:hypothetical protein